MKMPNSQRAKLHLSLAVLTLMTGACRGNDSTEHEKSPAEPEAITETENMPEGDDAIEQIDLLAASEPETGPAVEAGERNNMDWGGNTQDKCTIPPPPRVFRAEAQAPVNYPVMSFSQQTVAQIGSITRDFCQRNQRNFAPNRADYTRRLPRNIRNQLEQPSCTVFAIAGAIESQASLLDGRVPDLAEAYMWMRQKFQPQSLARALAVHMKLKTILEPHYPYIKRRNRRAPGNATQFQHAGRFAGYHFETAERLNSGDEIAEALKNQKGVIGGLSLNDSWRAPATIAYSVENLLQVPSQKGIPKSLQTDHAIIPGGKIRVRDQDDHPSHAVHVIGFERRNGVEWIKVRNSWGEKWGGRGLAWVPLSYCNTPIRMDWGSARFPHRRATQPHCEFYAVSDVAPAQ